MCTSSYCRPLLDRLFCPPAKTAQFPLLHKFAALATFGYWTKLGQEKTSSNIFVSASGKNFRLPKKYAQILQACLETMLLAGV